ncbi:MAG: Calx-beta domain-containing protein [Chthoniobacteraceae bacterium]
MSPLPGVRWRKAVALALSLNVAFAKAEDPPVSSTAPGIATAEGSPGFFEVQNDFYPVREDAGALTVKVLRKEGTFGSVTLFCRAIRWDSSSGAADPGSDFALDSSTLTFEHGQTEQTATIRILKDGLVEGSERFMFEISRYPSDYTMSRAAVMILDVDDPGSLVTSFVPIVNPQVPVLHVERNGNIIMDDGMRVPRGLTRVGLDGALSSVFAGSQEFQGYPGIRALTALPDGRLYIAGPFKAINGEPRPGLALIQQDGTLDPGFAPTVGPIGSVDGPIGSVNAAAVQSDGSLIVMGGFLAIGNAPHRYLARFRPDGTFDPTYAPAAPFRGTRLLMDSKDRAYYAEGPQIVRLSADGAIDLSFKATITLAQNDLVDIVLDEEERVIVCGRTTFQVNGQWRRYLARLTETGALEPSLSVGPSQSYYPTAVAIQPDGRILLATQAISGSSAGIVRLRPDGSGEFTNQSKDPTFKVSVSGVVKSGSSLNRVGSKPLCGTGGSGNHVSPNPSSGVNRGIESVVGGWGTMAGWSRQWMRKICLRWHFS